MFVVHLALDGKGEKELSVVSLFSLKTQVNFDVDVTRSAASHKPRPHDTGITCFRRNVGRRGAHTDGGY
jgi:hypothetical protein